MSKSGIGEGVTWRGVGLSGARGTSLSASIKIRIRNKFGADGATGLPAGNCAR